MRTSLSEAALRVQDPQRVERGFALCAAGRNARSPISARQDWTKSIAARVAARVEGRIGIRIGNPPRRSHSEPPLGRSVGPGRAIRRWNDVKRELRINPEMNPRG